MRNTRAGQDFLEYILSSRSTYSGQNWTKNIFSFSISLFFFVNIFHRKFSVKHGCWLVRRIDRSINESVNNKKTLLTRNFVKLFERIFSDILFYTTNNGNDKSGNRRQPLHLTTISGSDLLLMDADQVDLAWMGQFSQSTSWSSRRIWWPEQISGPDVRITFRCLDPARQNRCDSKAIWTRPPLPPREASSSNKNKIKIIVQYLKHLLQPRFDQWRIL